MKIKNIGLSIALATMLLQAEDINLGEVTVTTATKTEKNIEGVSASVIVIDEKTIEKMGASTLGDVISKTPGLIRQYGTFPSASSKSKSSISIRGMGATGTLFLIDGQRIAGEVKNPYDLDRIPASIIERIEIVKGPMSTLYGADAVGGVINIITKQPKDRFQGSMGIQSGSNTKGEGRNNNAYFNMRGKKNKLKYSFYTDISHSTPYTQKERTYVKLGGQKLSPSQLQKVPIVPYLKPNNPQTHGNPFYLQPDKTSKPIPLDPNLVNLDRKTALDDFNRFKNDFKKAGVKDFYDTDVTYRERANVFNVGTKVEYELNEQTSLGIDFSYMKEERWGVYNAYAHPFGVKPPIGHPKNPIVGHKPDGTPVSFVDKIGHPMGMCPAWNVPVNSHDKNDRRNIGAFMNYLVNDDLSLKLHIYNSYYRKRNITTMKYWKDFGFKSEKESAANSMNANVDITSYELLANYALNDAHLLTFGTEYRDEEREATVFDSTPNMGKKEVDYKAIYLQDEWEVSDTLNVIGGARYDAISNADNKATFRLGAVKNFSKLFNLRVNFAQGYRTPDIRELYINKQTPMGLIQGAEVVGYDLKPEFTNSYEISASGTKEHFSYEVAFFLNKIDDRIQKVAGSNPGSYTFINVSDAETKGMELTLTYDFENGFTTELTWNELRTEDKKTKKDLEFNPDRVVALKCDYTFSKNFNINLIATYTGKEHYTQMTPKGKVELTTDPFTLVDLTASYKFAQNYELFGGVNNLFDEDVDDVLGSTVGTYIYAGLRVNF
ncbi:TonB-dependent siderophore receptor [Nitratiruptor sp. YY09-18]|uniref:TonB-dependent receptor plug domain-containing protein n=1 Tax=Nitratiruptor sp. YY09-18 TaxID=2724901 RepID=UPI00191530EE|nr:TonB-dependent receptor [Nitratiruptor sp. YY09-18]BCD68717.1 outer membrane receptor for ferrienterochelin and colicins [Nitratiruptor sp. YY09-18]